MESVNALPEVGTNARHGKRRPTEAAQRDAAHATPTQRIAAAATLAIVSLLADGAPAAQAGTDPLVLRLAMSECTSRVREEGVAACRRALALGPAPERASTAYSMLSLHLAVLERWDEAVVAYREVVRLRPEDAEARWRLGDALFFGLGQADEAESVLREAAALDASSSDIHASLAAVLNAQGRHEEAVAEMEEARRLDPRLFDTRPASHEVYRAAREGRRWPH